jgi:hypothetical protein
MPKFKFGETVYVSTGGCEGQGIILREESPVNSKYEVNSTDSKGFTNGKRIVEVDASALSKVDGCGAAYAGLRRS